MNSPSSVVLFAFQTRKEGQRPPQVDFITSEDSDGAKYHSPIIWCDLTEGKTEWWMDASTKHNRVTIQNPSANVTG